MKLSPVCYTIFAFGGVVPLSYALGMDRREVQRLLGRPGRGSKATGRFGSSDMMLRVLTAGRSFPTRAPITPDTLLLGGDVSLEDLLAGPWRPRRPELWDLPADLFRQESPTPA